jgi:hypothetical protein
LGNFGFSLSLFGENAGTNRGSHVRNLDEFMRLRCIPKAHQLETAYKSVTGSLGRQRLQDVSVNMKNYGAIKTAF